MVSENVKESSAGSGNSAASTDGGEGLARRPSKVDPNNPVELEQLIGRDSDSSDFSFEDSDAEIEQEFKKSKAQRQREWMYNAVASAVLILLWYIFSVGISVYNKWLFSPDKMDFAFPVFSTSGHQFIQFVLAFLITKWKSRKQPQEAAAAAAPPFNWREYFGTFLPCGAASAGDIGMGNASMRIVSLTFYTMVKSSNLGFVLIFSILFRLERPNWRLTAIIAVMSAGVVMMVAGEAEFQMLGFLLVLGAAACSGLRWSLTQLLMKRPDNTISTHGNPLNTILYLSPLMGVLLFVAGMFIEGPQRIASAALWSEKGILGGLLILTFPGVLAFCMTLSEFMLLNQTSVLTLSIAGIFKEVVTLIVAAFAFGDRLTMINSIGLLTTLVSIVAYNWYRYSTI